MQFKTPLPNKAEKNQAFASIENKKISYLQDFYCAFTKPAQPLTSK